MFTEYNLTILPENEIATFLFKAANDTPSLGAGLYLRISAILTDKRPAAIIPDALKAHLWLPVRAISPWANSEYTTPPKPVPESIIPIANPRFFKNHPGMTLVAGDTMNGIPRPNKTPWVKYSCQSFLAKDARINPPHSSTTPMNKHDLKPNILITMLASGTPACPKVVERPAINA